MQLSLFFIVGLVLALTNARTILWTNAGGNPLWNNPGNWDCQCLPTISDDVIIDIQAIPGNVQISGATAFANSLAVGGTSRFGQTLTINGALSLGNGGSKLSANGRIMQSAGPESPFNNDGTFAVDGNGFTFVTGVLSGKGSFNFASGATLNFTGPAQKVISTTVIVSGKVITDTSAGTNILINKGGSFIVAGTFTTAKSLTIQTDSKSTVSVKGSLVFTGPVLELQGTGFTISQWSIGAGSVATIDNAVTSGTLALQGTLTLIGAPQEMRTFGSITGSGFILNLGGTNSFTSVQAAGFNATGGNATIASGSIGTLTLKGGFLYGGKVSVGNAIFETGFLQGGINVAATNAFFQGVVNFVDDRTSVTVTGSGFVTKDSLITLTAGSSFNIASSATFRQNAPLQIVSGAPTTNNPVVNINGVFISSSLFTVSGVPINGTGAYTLTSTASWSLTNVKFGANSINSAGSVALSVGSFTVNSISGTGSFSGNPNPFVSTSFSGLSFTLNSGNVRAANVTLQTLTLNSGNFGVSGSGKIGTFNFVGGKLSGTAASTQVPFTIAKTVVSGGATQTLNNIGITTSALSLDCALKENCQLITSNSYIKTA